jgi:hypothetical protein
MGVSATGHEIPPEMLREVGLDPKPQDVYDVYDVYDVPISCSVITRRVVRLPPRSIAS